MRVGFAIHHVRPTGGQDRYALELARRLAPRCELHLWTISVAGDLPASVRVHLVAAPGRPMALAAPLFRRGAAGALRAGYDVVHGVGGALPGASVVTAQFCAAEWRRLDADATLYQRFVSAQAVRDERRTYRHPALRAVIAVSHRTSDEIVRHYGPLRVPIAVVPNAVDAARFGGTPSGAPSGAPRPAGRPRLLFVGAFERKGLDTAIRALARMRSPAELVAIGSGDVESHRALAAELGVGERVRLEPPRGKIEEAFAAADAFIFPTRYEPFGMVIAEALASGVPVVTTAVAGAAELIRNGESGFVIADPADAAAFAAAADRVLTTPGLRETMGRAARAAVKDLTWDMVADKTWEIYEAVAAAARAGGARP